jgi:hypothetical protein
MLIEHFDRQFTRIADAFGKILAAAVRGLRRLAGEKDNFDAFATTEADAVLWLQLMTRDAATVDPCTVRALQVDDEPGLSFPNYLRMLAWSEAMAEDDVGIGAASDEDARGLKREDVGATGTSIHSTRAGSSMSFNK